MLANNAINSDNKQRRAFVAPIFNAGYQNQIRDIKSGTDFPQSLDDMTEKLTPAWCCNKRQGEKIVARILAVLLFAASALAVAAETANDPFEFGIVQQDYGMDLVANYRDGALSVAVVGKKIQPAQADENGMVVIADNRIVQFSVMRVASKSGKSIVDMDARQILEGHRRSRVSFIEPLNDKRVASEPGKFQSVNGRDLYFWHVDTAPAPGMEGSKPDKTWRHLHATTLVGDLIAILIVPLTPTDDERAARRWLAKTAATLTVHSKPLARTDDGETAARGVR